MSAEEYQQLWDDLLLIDKTCAPDVLSEVLHALLPDAPDVEFKPSPYPETSERHRIWCAIQYAVLIGNYASARELAAQLGHAAATEG
jgi:hypothetical protein